MAKNEGRLVCHILNEVYGEVISNMSAVLIRKGPLPLRLIAQESKLDLNQVRKSLCVLVQLKMASYEQNKKGFIEYRLDMKRILLHTRYPRFIYCAKTLYGDAAELIVEELLHHGELLMSKVVDRVAERLQETLTDGTTVPSRLVEEKFQSLVETHFIQRCGVATDTDSAVPSISVDERLMYDVPDISTGSRKRKRSTAGHESSKKQKTDNDEPPDAGIYWCINIDRFEQHIRDQSIAAAVTSKLDPKAGEIVRTVLRLSEVRTSSHSYVTQPIAGNEIFRAIPKEVGITKQAMDEYFTLLTEDSANFVSKITDSGGGMYSINFKLVSSSLCKAHMESIVQERFGSKSCRIFRLLLAKKHLEQKQIEEFAMIPAKEAKELLYNMFTEHFITTTEISKTPDHAPSRTFYLFSVNMNQLTRLLLQMCYKAMFNAIVRRQHETNDNRRLLEKNQRVQAIVASLEGNDAAQKDEIEAMITPPERNQIQKVKHTTNKLEQSEVQLDETIFILQMYLMYAHLPS